MVAQPHFNERFAFFVQGSWHDSMGNAVTVCGGIPGSQVFQAKVTPMIQHPAARSQMFAICKDPDAAPSAGWRCGIASLELVDECRQRIVWVTPDGRRSVWWRDPEVAAPAAQAPPAPTPAIQMDSEGRLLFEAKQQLQTQAAAMCRPPYELRPIGPIFGPSGGRMDYEGRGDGISCSSSSSKSFCTGGRRFVPAFPWLLNPSPKTPCPEKLCDVPRDIMLDGARVAAILDIRQLIGAMNEQQEQLTHILMDHDLQPEKEEQDYLVPGIDSTVWCTLQVPTGTLREILARLRRIADDPLAHPIAWSGENEILVGHHRIDMRGRARDVQVLEDRWQEEPDSPLKSFEIARLLALYSVFDNPLSNRRSGLHLGLSCEIRSACDIELFASPLNAVVPNGQFASKWPHIERRFGSMGKYPQVLKELPIDAVVCVNPPFTEAYLADVMERLAELKLRFRLRFAFPIKEASWRRKLQRAFPLAQVLHTYYDASQECSAELCHPTLLWEDPRCKPPEPDPSEAKGQGPCVEFDPPPWVDYEYFDESQAMYPMEWGFMPQDVYAQ